ncbi:MAG: hypothetical protein KGJ58_02140 [Patescibacteria group bacterium]|nr:hypothetical protein [Patescibacteria group bacterium]MDE1988331.1 hypothetical protein [Patescibacteria group bacterium]MDE2218227.1 hypothetical protein [Patescibacteria group bacterium]
MKKTLVIIVIILLGGAAYIWLSKGNKTEITNTNTENPAGSSQTPSKSSPRFIGPPLNDNKDLNYKLESDFGAAVSSQSSIDDTTDKSIDFNLNF